MASRTSASAKDELFARSGGAKKPQTKTGEDLFSRPRTMETSEDEDQLYARVRKEQKQVDESLDRSLKIVAKIDDQARANSEALHDQTGDVSHPASCVILRSYSFVCLLISVVHRSTETHCRPPPHDR